MDQIESLDLIVGTYFIHLSRSMKYILTLKLWPGFYWVSWPGFYWVSKPHSSHIKISFPIRGNPEKPKSFQPADDNLSNVGIIKQKLETMEATRENCSENVNQGQYEPEGWAWIPVGERRNKGLKTICLRRKLRSMRGDIKMMNISCTIYQIFWNTGRN